MTFHTGRETPAWLLTQTTISPRPWELICNRVPGHDFTTGKPIKATVPVVSSLRIVDADNRLLVRIQADSEQSLKPEDMQLIVAAVNESAALVARCEELERERDERVARMMSFESMASKQRERAEAAEDERDQAVWLLRQVVKADNDDAKMGHPNPGDSCVSVVLGLSVMQWLGELDAGEDKDAA